MVAEESVLSGGSAAVVITAQTWTQSIRDSNGDGIGDLNGLGEHIDDLRRIGVQSVRIHPLLAHGSDSNDAYDTTDFKQVHQEIGTLADFDKLVTQIHGNCGWQFCKV